MPRASVVICTYNRRDSLKRCLDSVISQTYKDFEIVIVDGGSTDGTLDLVKGYHMKLVQQIRRGVVNAYNCGVRKAEGDIIAFIDDDCIADEKWLENIVGAYGDFKRAGGVGGKAPQIEVRRRIKGKRSLFWTLYKKISAKIKWVIVYENPKGPVIGKIFRSGGEMGNFYFNGSIIEVDHVRGCNMSFIKKILESIGGFDENYEGKGFRFETDACLRVKKAGYSIIYNPFAKVVHYVDPTKWYTVPYMFFQHKNDIYFYFKNCRAKTLSDWLRFLTYQIFTTLDCVSDYFTTKNKAFLYAIAGKIIGMREAIKYQL